MALQDKGFRIVHINCQSLKNKLQVLKYHVQELNVELFTLSETRLTPNFPDGILERDRFDFFGDGIDLGVKGTMFLREGVV